jgi:glycosyltransferase involved in cell wall biosynthesis
MAQREAELRGVSVVVPMYNEAANARPFWENLSSVLDTYGQPYEIIFVDDGSRDGTVDELRALAAADPHVKLVLFRRNYGQTAAMHAGIQHASLDVVVTMDGDQQNDPRDIPMMVEKLSEGFDLVHGWRKDRQDALVNRKIPSRIANWLISRVTRFPIHDLGCTLKAMRREIAQELELYGEMHRFIPILAHQRGARCVEVVARHHPRRLGQTKYGISRTFRVVLDLMTVTYLLRYFASPMKLFGMAGLFTFVVTAVAAATTLGMKIAGGVDMTGNPLLLLTAMSMFVSVQFFSLGLLGEVNARIYFSDTSKSSYAVRELINFERDYTTVRLPRTA